MEAASRNIAKKYNVKLEVPGLLFVDTPGHEAFVNLRKRGGSIADIVILVVDSERGLENQAKESLEILRERKTPFLVAFNKVDKIPEWKPHPEKDVVADIDSQSPKTRSAFDTLLYRLVGELSELGFQSDRFDRVSDFRRSVAIVPVSAVTGEGLPELMLMAAGLCQVFLRNRLTLNPEDTRGIVLEVKEETGLGTTLDVIVYDGVLRKGDQFVVGGFDSPLVSRVKTILVPRSGVTQPGESKFIEIEEAPAAMGVKIVASGVESAIAGSPLVVYLDGPEAAVKAVRSEIESVRIKSDKKGVVVKADALGSLEAIAGALVKRNVPVRYADIGNISRRDLLEASVTKKEDPLLGVVLAFNVRFAPGAEDEASNMGIPVFRSKLIYEIIEGYTAWMEQEKQKMLTQQLSTLVRPGRAKILPGHVFRRANPIIVGVEVEAGTLRPDYPLINAEGKAIGKIMQIQYNGEPVESAAKGQSVAISVRSDLMVGRQVQEGDKLYVDVPDEHSLLMRTKYRENVDAEELELLEELKSLKAR
ncbi:MAG: translation initiation factor IF-2 [Thermoprotei archaeon]